MMKTDKPINDCSAIQYNGLVRYCSIDSLKPCERTIKETCPMYILYIKSLEEKKDGR